MLISSLKKVTLVNYKSDRTLNYQIFTIHLMNRGSFTNYMWSKGIQVMVNNEGVIYIQFLMV